MSTQFSLPVRLNPVINPWLSNHVFQGPKGPSAILPGVAFLQMAADGAASHCPFIPVIKLQNIRFKRLVSVPLDQRKTLFLHHEIDETPEGIRDRVQLKDPEPSEKEPYAEAEVILNTALPVYPSHGNSGLLRRVPQEPHVLRGRLIYESGYFENKGFMAMACAMSVVNPQLALLNFSPFISADLQAQQIACGSVLPLALDMGFEGAGWLDLWHSFQAKETIDGLRSPSFVRSVTYYRPLLSRELQRLRVQVERETPNASEYSMIFFLERSEAPVEVVALVEGFKTVLWERAWGSKPKPTRNQFFGIE